VVHLVYLVIAFARPRYMVYHRGDRAHAKVDGFALRLDVEVRDEDESNETIAAGLDIVILNNIEGSELASVTCRLREPRVRHGKVFLLETSGSITESNLRELAMTGK
jgi:nicotinate-nucleotide pyrophosphorylase (carboxylating)